MIATFTETRSSSSTTGTDVCPNTSRAVSKNTTSTGINYREMERQRDAISKFYRLQRKIYFNEIMKILSEKTDSSAKNKKFKPLICLRYFCKKAFMRLKTFRNLRF
jgi:hypothetical protein